VTIRRLAVVLLITLLWPSTTLADPASGAPNEMVDRLLQANLPGRDPVDLAVRLRGLVQVPLPSIRPAPLLVGREDAFWILDQRTAQLFQTRATLRLVTDHAYWFVETTLADRAPQADLERSAGVFERSSYPLVHKYFGAEPTPGVDGDPRIVFLLANVPGVAAYFSSADAYPRAINPRSNEHEMIYINLSALRPGQQGFDSTLVHEFQHMVHFARCPNQEGWIDEGASELATRVAGYEGGPPQALMAQPGVQLNAWSPATGPELVRHYQAAYLFLRYVAERDGGWDALPRLFESCARGEGLFSDFVKRESIAPDVESLFADWAVANLIQDATVEGGRYRYGGGSFHASATGTASGATPFLGSVPQYAANYVDLSPGQASATFAGDATVSLVDVPTDGGAWWSNRGDSMDSRLTRRLELSSVSEATLRFQAWYDLESQFDYVYLSASRDGGQTWHVLPGQRATADRATGNNYGMGWTGSSGADWVDEEVDLTSLAGSEVLVRFDYVTDQSYNGEGFALRNLSVPELDLSEPGASEDPWTAEGWVRLDGPIPQRWNLRLVRWTPSGIHVDRIGVALDGTATFPLDPTATRSSLVIAPTAPRTLLPANYSLTLNP
jgi:immune inhibitor A